MCNECLGQSSIWINFDVDLWDFCWPSRLTKRPSFWIHECIPEKWDFVDLEDGLGQKNILGLLHSRLSLIWTQTFKRISQFQVCLAQYLWPSLYLAEYSGDVWSGWYRATQWRPIYTGSFPPQQWYSPTIYIVLQILLVIQYYTLQCTQKLLVILYYTTYFISDTPSITLYIVLQILLVIHYQTNYCTSYTRSDTILHYTLYFWYS